MDPMRSREMGTTRDGKQCCDENPRTHDIEQRKPDRAALVEQHGTRENAENRGVAAEHAVIKNQAPGLRASPLRRDSPRSRPMTIATDMSMMKV